MMDDEADPIAVADATAAPPPTAETPLEDIVSGTEAPEDPLAAAETLTAVSSDDYDPDQWIADGQELGSHLFRTDPELHRFAVAELGLDRLNDVAHALPRIPDEMVAMAERAGITGKKALIMLADIGAGLRQAHNLGTSKMTNATTPRREAPAPRPAATGNRRQELRVSIDRLRASPAVRNAMHVDHARAAKALDALYMQLEGD